MLFSQRVAWIVLAVMAFLAALGIVVSGLLHPQGFASPPVYAAIGAFAVIGAAAVATRWNPEYGMDLFAVGISMVVWAYVLAQPPPAYYPTGAESLLILAAATLVVGWRIFTFVAAGNIVILMTWTIIHRVEPPSTTWTSVFIGTVLLATISGSRYALARDLAIREAESHRLSERLSQKEAFENAATRLINSMAHEIRTPLTVIAAHSESHPDESKRQALHRAVDRAKKSVDLVQLNLRAELARQNVQPAGTIREALELALNRRFPSLPGPKVDVEALGLTLKVASYGKTFKDAVPEGEGLRLTFDDPLDYSRADHLEEVMQAHGGHLEWDAHHLSLRWHPSPDTV